MGKRTVENYKTNAREEGRIWSWPEEKMPEWEQGFPTQLLNCPHALPCPAHLGAGHGMPQWAGTISATSMPFFHPDPSQLEISFHPNAQDF